jgi:hypothetical protein
MIILSSCVLALVLANLAVNELLSLETRSLVILRSMLGSGNRVGHLF